MATDLPFNFAGLNFQQNTSVHKIGTDALALATFTEVGGAQTLLDIGCGTGILALSLVANHLNLKATAIDSSIEACQLATHNVRQNGLQNRVSVLHAALNQYFTEVPKKSFDCIVSNPPYFSEAVSSNKHTRITARNQSALPPAQLMKACSHLLHDDGKLWLIIPDTQLQNYREHACLQGLYFNLEAQIIREGVQSVGRTIICFSKEAAKFKREVHHIYLRESVI